MVQVRAKATTLEKAIEKKVAEKTEKKVSLAHGVGRRKSSVARVWLRRGSGQVVIKGLDAKEYFDTELDHVNATKAFRVVPHGNKYDARVTLKGGGKVSQSDAVKLAISRSFLALDESLRVVLRDQGLLTVDDRVKERKKYGRKAARRRFQFVKR